MTHLRRLLPVAAFAASVFLAAASDARADMIGLTVDGALYFGANPTNYFDPGNGFVPVGFLNTAGTSVVIGAGDEFGFDDSSNRDTALFTGTQLIIQDSVLSSGNNNPITMVFTAPWLVGASIFELADSFNGAGLTASLLGDTLTLNWAGGAVTQGSAMRAVYDLTPGVPEPATLLLFGAGLAATGLRRRNRKLN